MNKNLDVKFYERQSRNFTIKAEYDKAVVISKRLIAINPKSFEYHYSWAQVQISQGNYRYAELKCRELLVLIPQHHNTFNIMGISLLNQGKYDQAVSFFKRGLKLSPDNHDLTHNLAVAVTKQGDYGEALRLCERGLNVHPHSGSLSSWMGYLYSLQGKYKEAILRFDDALRYYTSHEMLYFNKALVLFCQKLEEEEEVKKVFGMGIEVIKKRAQMRLPMKAAVDHYNGEMNRIGKELGRDELGHEAKVNLEKVQKGFVFVLDLLRIEMEKLEN